MTSTYLTTVVFKSSTLLLRICWSRTKVVQLFVPHVHQNQTLCHGTSMELPYDIDIIWGRTSVPYVLRNVMTSSLNHQSAITYPYNLMLSWWHLHPLRSLNLTLTPIFRRARLCDELRALRNNQGFLDSLSGLWFFTHCVELWWYQWEGQWWVSGSSGLNHFASHTLSSVSLPYILAAD